ncbi:MAG: transcriptional regulator [Blastopirellula sp.]|nr:MAG: transcriptional regulator [Blastopirellula sp.]
MPNTSTKTIMKGLSPSRQKRIRKKAAEEIRVYLTLQELRKKLGITQTDLAENLGVSQANISKLESCSDMRVSTLQNYIEMLGCELEIVVKTPDKTRVHIEKLIGS